MLEIKNLNKKYYDKLILDNINCTFEKQNVHLIVGINGSGKTTLLNIISNVLQLDSGRIVIDEFELGTDAYRKKIYYVPSDFYLPEYMTASEYVSFLSRHYEKFDFKKFNTLLNLLDLETSTSKTLESFSYGMKKKIQICLAIASNTKYVLFDEIFSGLDFETVILVENILAEVAKERTVIIVTHDKNVLEKFSENIKILKDKKIIDFNGTIDMLYEMIYKEGEIHEKIELFKNI